MLFQVFQFNQLKLLKQHLNDVLIINTWEVFNILNKYSKEKQIEMHFGVLFFNTFNVVSYVWPTKVFNKHLKEKLWKVQVSNG